MHDRDRLYNVPPRAPRLHSFLTYRYSVLTMPRPIWLRVKPPNAKPVLIDVDTTPLQDIDRPGVHCEAEIVGGTEYRVSVYRPDPKDAAQGFPINQDRYRLWEGFPDFLDLRQIVNECSTGLDPNLQAYIDERVFLVKQAPDDDHWLPDYPPRVRLLIQSG